MKHRSLIKLGLRVLGTVVLAVGFVFFVGRAPFLPNSGIGEGGSKRPDLAAVGSPDFGIATGAMNAPSLPRASTTGPGIGLEPSFGLFNASFADSLASPGFETSEHRIPGSCSGAGRRYIAKECPACEPIGDDGSESADMLMWKDAAAGVDVVHAVSRNCVSVAADGVPVVGTLRFGDGAVDLTSGSMPPDGGRVPLLPGATRVASVSLGDWFATYDDVARPSSALPDMAIALLSRGWREVLDPAVLSQDAFQGHRVFTDSRNALCVISLTKQGESFQLLTVINSRV